MRIDTEFVDAVGMLLMKNKITIRKLTVYSQLLQNYLFVQKKITGLFRVSELRALSFIDIVAYYFIYGCIHLYLYTTLSMDVLIDICLLLYLWLDGCFLSI